MAENNSPSLMERIRASFINFPGFKAPFFAALMTPTNPHRLPLINRQPRGLQLLHLANTSAEAEMLCQILIDNGFHPEFVPTPAAGVFGITGSNLVHVPSDEFEEAKLFVEQFQEQFQSLPEEEAQS